MNCFKLFLMTFVSSCLFVSCSKEELPVFPSNGNYENGFFVLNEGTAANGTISFIKSNFSSVTNNIFSLENSDENGTGGYLQSMFFSGDKAYIISGAANKITVVNRYSFKLISTIETGLNVPRYGVVFNGKAYVTNLGDFSSTTDDFITVINLSNNQVETPIQVNGLADKITEENGKLYVLNGSYGDGNSITIIDSNTKKILNTIDTGAGLSPNSFEEYNGSLYVLCGNATSINKILKIDFNTDTIQPEITLDSSLIGAQNLNIDNSNIYFTVGNKIYKSAVDVTSIPADSNLTLTSQPSNLYGFEVKSNVLYVGNANGNSDGKALVFSNTGSLLYDIAVGVYPNGFYFN